MGEVHGRLLGSAYAIESKELLLAQRFNASGTSNVTHLFQLRYCYASQVVAPVWYGPVLGHQ